MKDNCVSPHTMLLLSNGEAISAEQVMIRVNGGTAVELMDEFGQPTNVTAVAAGYNINLEYGGDGIPGVQRVPNGLLVNPYRDMYEFTMVDYDPLAGQAGSTHPPLVVTADHVMMLMSHTGYAGNKSWKWHDQRNGVTPAGAVISLRAAGPGLAGPPTAAIRAEGPPLWRPTAAEFAAWLNHGQITYPGHNVNYVPIPLVAAAGGAPVPTIPAGLDPALVTAGAPPGHYDDGAGSNYTYVQNRYGWAAYQPSARSWYITAARPFRPANDGPLPRYVVAGSNVAQGAIPAQAANGVEGPTPMNFRIQHLPGPVLGHLRGVIADELGIAVSHSLLKKVAYCIGLWLADGDSATAVIIQADWSRAAAGGGRFHPHMEAIDTVRECVNAMMQLIPGSPLHGPGYLRWRRLHEEAAFKTPHGVVPAGGNQVWDLYMGFTAAFNPHAPSRTWFRRLLVRFGILGFDALGRSRKRIPMGLLTDEIMVRRWLLAGYIDGDGSLNVEGNDARYVVGVALAARPLVNDVCHLVRGLGLGVGAFTNGNSTDELGHSFPSIEITISGSPKGMNTRVPGGVHPRHPAHIPVQMTYKEMPHNPDPHAVSWSFQRNIRGHADNVPPRVRQLPASCEWVAITTAATTMLTAETIVIHNCTTVVKKGSGRKHKSSHTKSSSAAAPPSSAAAAASAAAQPSSSLPISLPSTHSITRCLGLIDTLLTHGTSPALRDQSRQELQFLLFKLDAGTSVNVDAIQDELVKHILQSMFREMGLKIRRDEETGEVGWMTPKNSNGVVGYKLLELLSDAFKKTVNSSQQKSDESNTAAIGPIGPTLPPPTSSSSTAADSSEATQSVVLGPAMPTQADLELLVASTDPDAPRPSSNQPDADDDADDFGNFGPKMPSQMTDAEQRAFAALQASRAQLSSLRQTVSTSNAPSIRESWMTSLPTSEGGLPSASLLASLAASGDKDALRGRSFLSKGAPAGRQQDESWTLTPGEKERRAQEKSAIRQAEQAVYNVSIGQKKNMFRILLCAENLLLNHFPFFLVVLPVLSSRRR